MYQLKLTTRAQRELEGLPEQDFGRIVIELNQLRSNPRPAGVRKVRGIIHRVRVGDWRILYAIFDKDNMVVVGKIARRSEDTYRDLEERF